jgi:hypothetical protein
MPSAEYFHRQADICLRLSLIATDEEIATRLLAMAEDYKFKAAAAEHQSEPVAPHLMSAPDLTDGAEQG